MKELFEKYFFLSFKEKAVNYLKSNPLLILLFLFGVILGNCFSFIISWIPILGGIFSFLFSFVGGILGVYLYYKIKKGEK